MNIWRSMVEQLTTSKPRLEDDASLNSLDDLLLRKDVTPLSEESVGFTAREEEDQPLTEVFAKDAMIASLKQKLQSTQTQAKLYEKKAAALASDNTSLKKELEARRAREQTLENELQQLMRKQNILQDAEERLCTQLADLEVEALEQSHQHTAQIRNLTSELQHKSALLTSLATTPPRNLSAPDTASSLQLAEEAKSHLQSLHRKHSLALENLHTAENEIAELKSTIDNLKAEMLSLDSARQTQLNLAKKAQKELESLHRQSYPIQIEAAGMLFNLRSPRALLVGAPTCRV